jgi:hypothetical protein
MVQVPGHSGTLNASVINVISEQVNILKIGGGGEILYSGSN